METNKESIRDKRILTITDNIDVNDNLFRYMSLAQFLSIVENNELFLKKVKLWEDTWEGPDDQLPIIMDDGTERYTESLLTSSTVGQCWTYEKDSDAMWRIYSPDRQGIMIETSVDSFYEINGLQRAVLAKVIYYNNNNYIKKRYEIANNKSYFFAGDMALKRDAFKHENEVRLLTCLQGYKEVDNCWEVPLVGFKFNPKTFIKSITFDPRADDWFVDTMTKYCSSKGLLCPTKKSSLYERNFFEKAKIVRRYEVINKTKED